MNRREFLKSLALGVIGCGIAQETIAQTLRTSPASLSITSDNHLRDYMYKMNHFNEPHKDDIKIDSSTYNVLKSTVMRLRRLQRLVGHGNFHLLSFNVGIRTARKYPEVGEFTKAEISLMEMIFYEDGQHYGFLGQKPLKKITDRIKNNDVVKVAQSGNYLFKGAPLETYLKIKQQLGEQVVLTSGVRGIMKQFLLFLNKAYKENGNLSLASRSLAPPGYSFHSNGDFDVGQVGFGALNFTKRFTTTEVYKKLSDMGYLKLRYEQDNNLGVRFEPWHIKIV
ncbi:MAG: D-alanyl-D-alanine carboxypeptidase family protein [Nitrospira sp.]|nr:D-alanyl-D-alanine carboxypeptidase family protein [Nitrospira sp.]